ncbi:arylesterase [Thioclava sp. BHET1]|nr:arylesterase [Thioclava sp. BHET1]
MPPFAYGVGARGGNSPLLRRAGLAILLTLLPLAASAAPLRLIMFGDSLTQGYGLPDGEGLVPQLQSWLRAKGHDVTLLNAGVSGDTTAGGLSRIDWTLAGGGDAVVVELGGNDMLRGISPSVTRANLDAILKKIRAKHLPVLLIGIPAAGNYGADYAKAFDAIYPTLAQKYHTALVPDYYAPLEAAEPRAAAMRDFLQADGIHPNAAGVKRIVPALGPAVAALLAQVPAATAAGN